MKMIIKDAFFMAGLEDILKSHKGSLADVYFIEGDDNFHLLNEMNEGVHVFYFYEDKKAISLRGNVICLNKKTNKSELIKHITGKVNKIKLSKLQIRLLKASDKNEFLYIKDPKDKKKFYYNRSELIRKLNLKNRHDFYKLRVIS